MKLYVYEIYLSEYNVYDGDTLKDVYIDLGFNIKIKIDLRLSRIDAPEIKSKDELEKQKGNESKEVLKALIKNGTNFKVEILKYDKYGRSLCDLYIDGTNINDFLLKENYAKEYS